MRVLVSIVGLGACVMVAVGFKAKWSAGFLVLVLSVFNVFANNWWSIHSAHPQRDFLKYDFFQTLCESVRAGFLVRQLIFLQLLWVVLSSSSTWDLEASPSTKRRKTTDAKAYTPSTTAPQHYTWDFYSSFNSCTLHSS